ESVEGVRLRAMGFPDSFELLAQRVGLVPREQRPAHLRESESLLFGEAPDRDETAHLRFAVPTMPARRLAGAAARRALPLVEAQGRDRNARAPVHLRDRQPGGLARHGTRFRGPKTRRGGAAPRERTSRRIFR